MKINEIIEPIHVERPISKPYNIEKMGQRQKIDTTNGGAYARGTPDPLDTHMYRKKIRMPSNLKNDAYYQYIKACSPFMKSNPYFPRVYEVVFKRYSNGLVKPAYNMEKLMTISEANSEIENLVEIIAEKIYTEKALAYHRLGELLLWNISSDIEKGIESSINMYEIFSDEKLIQAIQLIQEVYNSNSAFSTDVHAGNIMIRLGPTGIQLVLTDPLQDNGSSIAAGYNPFSGSTVGYTNDTADDDNDSIEDDPF